jgi:hypothetical protein
MAKRPQQSTDDFLAEVTGTANITRLPAQSGAKSGLRLDDGTLDKLSGPREWAQVNLKVSKAEKLEIALWAKRHDMSLKDVLLEGYKLLREKKGG